MALWGTKDTVYSTGKVNCTTAGVLSKQSGSLRNPDAEYAEASGPQVSAGQRARLGKLRWV